MAIGYKLQICIGLLLGSICLSCNNIQSKEAQEKANTVLVFQPFSGFSPHSLTYLEKKLHKNFPTIVINTPIDLPNQALNSTQKRYRADSLIHFLQKKGRPNETIIGLTKNDISMTKKGISDDYGVFGYGFCPGNACVVSTFRIKGSNKLEKLYKLTVHEIGHTLGLPHCAVKTCFMRDAKGKDHFDELTDFCQKCSEKVPHSVKKTPLPNE